MKPLLFVDVDGVLNCPAGPEPTHRLTLPSRGRARGLIFDGVERELSDELHIPVWLIDGAAQRLERLARTFECVWATSWHASALALGPLLGHERAWPLLDWGRDEFKLPAIIRHAAGRPWAFVDDDAEWELDNTRALPGMTGPSWLLVQTDARVGLTDADVLTLERFAERVT